MNLTRLKFGVAAFALAALSIFGLAGCGKQEAVPPTVEQQRAEALSKAADNAKLQELLEQQRSIALANASANGANYFASNPRFDASWKVVPHTDDYISPSCPQGSGWAWLSVMQVIGKEVDKKIIWCSTSSASVGCYIDADFKKSPYAAQAAKCDPNLPHPLKPFSR